MTSVYLELSQREARRILLATVGPANHPGDADDLLASMRHIQIDPIDRIGTNADLVAFARSNHLRRGDIYRAAGFEHFAKEWCLLPPSAFPYYKEQARRTPTWRHNQRMRDLPESVLRAVLEEVTERGPCTPADLGDHGRAEGSGSAWSGSRKLGTLALKVLALRCSLVVTGRRRGARVYDTPARAMPAQIDRETTQPFLQWGVKERVAACGMLPLRTGPWWSMLKEARRDGTVAALLAEGSLREVTVKGARTRYLVEPESLDAKPSFDGEMRLIGPLDPLIWSRPLIEQAFGFRYLWEVYKPAAAREWGYYVVPLLHRGQFVGRFEGRVVDGRLVTENVWKECDSFDVAALERALERHAHKLGCER